MLVNTDVSTLIRLALALFPTIFGVGRTSRGVITPKDVDGRLAAEAGGNLPENSDIGIFFGKDGGCRDDCGACGDV